MIVEKKSTLEDDVFAGLQKIIYECSGIFFPRDKKYLLENRLAKRVEGGDFGSFENYLHFLNIDSMRERELSHLFDVVTTHETSFFRDIGQIQAFETVILPQIIKSKSDQGKKNHLRVWSAACSTGEEPYTISMILSDNLSRLQGWDFEIIASDISESALNVARTGVYGNHALRNMPDQYFRKYFNTVEGRHIVKPAARDRVKFMHVNLFDNTRVQMIRNVDIIFCRNVLIYFDDEARKKVVSSLGDCLTQEGFMLVGHSESLYNMSSTFKMVQAGNAIVYRKR